MKPITLLSLLALLALSACGTSGGGVPGGPAASAAIARIGAIFGRGGEAAPPPALTRAALAGTTIPILQVGIPSRQATALFTSAAVNGPSITWISGATPGQGGITVTTESGLLVATRGLGADLMSSDVSGPVTALARGGGRYRRDIVFLDGEDQAVSLTPECVMEAVGPEEIIIVERRHRVVRYVENCVGAGGLAFSGVYWLEGGRLRASQQWTGRVLGQVAVNVVQP
ncbi:MAG: YjbF family lipoprotein [Pseudomonadota bacterium]